MQISGKSYFIVYEFYKEKNLCLAIKLKRCVYLYAACAITAIAVLLAISANAQTNTSLDGYTPTGMAKKLSFQDGEEFDNLYDILLRSDEAVLWIDKDNRVMGLQTDGRLIIPPIQGIKFYERERKGAIVLSVVFFVIGVVYYVYLKKRSNLDWKLGPEVDRVLSRPDRHHLFDK